MRRWTSHRGRQVPDTSAVIFEVADRAGKDRASSREKARPHIPKHVGIKRLVLAGEHRASAHT